MLHTQKARGIRALMHLELPQSLGISRPSHHYLTERPEEPLRGLPGFARPCPIRPRHGFVESRRVQDLADLQAVWDEARAVDPEAELVVGPDPQYLRVHASAVLAGNRLALGPGNDGATGGRGAFEVGCIRPHLNTAIRTAAGIDGTPYFEVIYDWRGTPHLVQLRDGPELPNATDFVPRETIVTSVVTPDDDLLAWEEAVAKFTPGTVVWAPGGSLASHAAVHCVLHDVPYVTSHRPEVGDVLEPIGPRPTALNPTEFGRGLGFAMRLNGCEDAHSYDGKRLRRWLLFSAAVLHNWAELCSWPSASRLLGAACGMVVRVGAILCAGEARHYDLSAGRQKEQSRVTPREYVYRDLLKASRGKLGETLAEAVEAFQGRGWSSGYGGPKWEVCARAVCALWEVCASSTCDVSTAVDTLNRVLHMVHNGGRLFNKVINNALLDAAAYYPAWGLITVGPLIMECLASDKRAAYLPPLPPLPPQREPDDDDNSSDDSSDDDDDDSSDDSSDGDDSNDNSSDDSSDATAFDCAQVRALEPGRVKVQFWDLGCKHLSVIFPVPMTLYDLVCDGVRTAQKAGLSRKSRHGGSSEQYLLLPSQADYDPANHADIRERIHAALTATPEPLGTVNAEPVNAEPVNAEPVNAEPVNAEPAQGTDPSGAPMEET